MIFLHQQKAAMVHMSTQKMLNLSKSKTTSVWFLAVLLHFDLNLIFELLCLSFHGKKPLNPCDCFLVALKVCALVRCRKSARRRSATSTYIARIIKKLRNIVTFYFSYFNFFSNKLKIPVRTYNISKIRINPNQNCQFSV